MTKATSRIPKPQGDGRRNGAEAIGVSHFNAWNLFENEGMLGVTGASDDSLWFIGAVKEVMYDIRWAGDESPRHRRGVASGR